MFIWSHRFVLVRAVLSLWRKQEPLPGQCQTSRNQLPTSEIRFWNVLKSLKSSLKSLQFLKSLYFVKFDQDLCIQLENLEIRRTVPEIFEIRREIPGILWSEALEIRRYL